MHVDTISSKTANQHCHGGHTRRGFLKGILSLLPLLLTSSLFDQVLRRKTISAFTRMISALRNRQDVGTLVDTTQIRQWHMYDTSAKHSECPTINFYDLNAQLFGPKAKSVGRRSHDVMNSLLSTESPDGGEEIKDGETDTWLDNVRGRYRTA
ncbi:hypothetical protein K503DRAFT_859801 [Rhizopogon vinicolor AM-OR11-026]|uniref:Uncharacterized protein n=1 Tax=Rhizopogon vinicolor AM-OR11-026 TaxID=1314800 RepID=A0A1B7MLD7_9AGAM|nr:hypothetical protein K503DRAFT_859801 [Rhizopogon vinicolor AM-OR11-026]